MNELIVNISDQKKEVKFTSDNKIIIDNKSFGYELIKLNGDTYLLKLNNEIFKITTIDENNTLTFYVNGKLFNAKVNNLLQEKINNLIDNENISEKEKFLIAPMPGIVLDVKIKIGNFVKKGDPLIILEAMKMENLIKSNIEGTVIEIYITNNQPINKGTKLIMFE